MIDMTGSLFIVPVTQTVFP